MDTDASCDDSGDGPFTGLVGRIARLRSNPLDPDEAGSVKYSLYETRAAAADLMIWLLVAMTAHLFFIGNVAAQSNVGGDGCTTVTENFASEGLPFLQRVVFVAGVAVVILAMLFYVSHKTPSKLQEDINWAKRGVMGIGVALLAPTLIQIFFGDIFGFSFADCVTGGLGFA